MKITQTIGIMNISCILGVVLFAVVMLVNWIIGWEVQYLLWIPIGIWVVTLVFAFVSALKLPGGFFEKLN